MKLCINCYTENADDAVFCSECGMSLMGAPTGEEATRLKELAPKPEVAAQPEMAPPPPGETATGQSCLAYRLAAALLFANAFLNILDGLLGGGTTLPAKIGPILVGLVVGVGLFRLHAGFRLWALFGAVLGAIAVPILFLLTTDALTTIWMSMMQWGLSGAIILLLTGKSKTWRLALAVGLYAVLVLIPLDVLFFVIALAWTLGVEL